MLSAQAASILGWYKQATAADLADGLSWYQRAEDLANALAAGTDFTVEQTAAVIAALSPRVPWHENVAGATDMVRAAARGAREPVVAGFDSNRAKAWRILHGEAIEDVLHGPKVEAFFRNITGDLDAVTVDVWAARAAGIDRDSFTPKQSAEVQDAYREAARVLDMAPRNLQACVWVCIRRIQLAASERHAWLLDKTVGVG